jgi:hypothetical protein
LTVESGIGFFDWIVDDPDRRARGLESARHSMGLLARIGGKADCGSALGLSRKRLWAPGPDGGRGAVPGASGVRR